MMDVDKEQPETKKSDTLTYYVIFEKLSDWSHWMIVGLHGIPGTYESYPQMYQLKETAERFAKQHREGYTARNGIAPETKVVELHITVPE